MKETDLHCATVHYEEPVMHMKFKENVEIEKEHVLELIAQAELLSNKKPYFLFSDARGFIEISAEAKKTAADKHLASLVKANAVVVDTLAMKLVGNAFLNVNKPHFPTRIFTCPDKAMEWLKNLADK